MWDELLALAARAFVDQEPFDLPYSTSNEFVVAAERHLLKEALRLGLFPDPSTFQSDPRRVSKATRAVVSERASGLCEWPECGEPGEHVHHRVALVDGGDSALTNLVLLCRWHHQFAHSPAGNDRARGLGIIQ